MPTTETVFFKNRRTDSSYSEALRKYRIDSDLEELIGAYTRCTSNKKGVKGSRVTIHSLREALGSFRIAPSNSYRKHLAAVKNKSDADAIRSDWEMVGEDLSYALIKHILAKKGTNV